MQTKAMILGVIASLFLFSGQAPAETDLQELIDLPAEVHETVKEKLADSKNYTEEQLETITECLEKADVQRIINCLSDDGLEDALEIGYMIRDEMDGLKEKVCGGSSYLEKDRCKKLQNDLKNMGTQIKNKWSSALASGKAFMEKRYELTRLKKRICDKIKQEGCWSWLNERLDIHCKPSSLDNDAEKLRQCRLKVANSVWQRVEARQ